jgi:hypothetical protein
MLATASAPPTETKVYCVNAGVNTEFSGTLGAPLMRETPLAASTFLDRLLTSYYALCQRERVPKLNYTEIARRVEGHTGIPVVQTTVTRWFTGSTPETPLMVGLCKALGEGLPGGIDPGWLHYGDDSDAPVPSFKPEERRFLPPITPAEADAGRHAKARSTRPKKGNPKRA